jgi:hypothetical protein
VPLLVVDGEIAAVLWGERWRIAEGFVMGSPETRITHFAVNFS